MDWVMNSSQIALSNWNRNPTISKIRPSLEITLYFFALLISLSSTCSAIKWVAPLSDIMGDKPKKKITIAPTRLKTNPIISIDSSPLCYPKGQVDIDSALAYQMPQ